MRIFALDNRKQNTAAVLLLLATVVLSAIYIRAEWDVARASRYAEGLKNELHRHWSTEQETCFDLRDLSAFGTVITSSAAKLDLIEHGLYCSVRHSSAQDECRFVIEVGDPMLVQWIIQKVDHGPFEIQEISVRRGLLRSLRQKIPKGEMDV